MIDVVGFQVWHAMAMRVHSSQREWFRCNFKPEDAASLEDTHSFTVMHNGTPIACGGVIELWRDRGMAWALLSEDSGQHMLAITRAAREIIQWAPCNRIEADVACGFQEGHRWMRILGFGLEAPRLKAYRGEGADCALYARVKK